MRVGIEASLTETSDTVFMQVDGVVTARITALVSTFAVFGVICVIGVIGVIGVGLAIRLPRSIVVPLQLTRQLASSAVAGSNLDLSKRTGQTASSLPLTGAADDTAGRGGEINTSSKKIADIIATRSGQGLDRHATGGRGRVVEAETETETEIFSSVQRVADNIGEITASASGQSSGLSQVDGTVGQLDQMSQQNAAVVEESAAAAQSLMEQAARLSGLVSKFRLA